MMTAMVIMKASAFWNHWLKMSRLKNDSTSELYLRVTIATNCGHRRRGNGSQNKDSTNAIHHIYSTYENDKDTLEPHTNKLNQDLDKA